MSDIPEYMMFRDKGVPPQFKGFPHRLALLPDGLTLGQLGAVAHRAAVFLVDADCAHDTLNGRAISAYFDARVPVLVHCQVARDLRPFKKRASALAARGYAVVLQ